MNESPKKSKKKFVIFAVLAGVVSFVVAAAVVGFILKAVLGGAGDRRLDDAVSQANAQLHPPVKIDAVTTLNSIKRGENSTIDYNYTLAGVDVSQVSYDTFSKKITSQACSSSEVRKVLDHNIGLNYHYTVNGQADYFHILVTQYDC